MDRLAERFEHLAVVALMALVMVTIFFGTLLTAWSLCQDLWRMTDLAEDPKALFEAFGLFVAVLVGVELLKILRHLLKAHEVDTTLVAETALMALCNKVITLNLGHTDWTSLVGVAALILALAAAILALRRKGARRGPADELPAGAQDAGCGAPRRPARAPPRGLTPGSS
jgi:uncharacterized membrane protein (DUF373 family)